MARAESGTGSADDDKGKSHMTDIPPQALTIAAVRKTDERRLYPLAGKRVLDLALVLLGLPFALPLLALASAAVACDGHWPVYGQVRIGRGGQKFRCWKLRTMVPDADQRLAAILRESPAAAREWRQFQKLSNDPRITRVGAFLRKTSLDELPQIFNVLAGSMSLIGPRPFTPDQQPEYDAEPGSGAYYALRPGLGGPWQVECRSRGAFRNRVGYDRAYAANITLAGDLRLLARTFLAVLRGSGC